MPDLNEASTNEAMCLYQRATLACSLALGAAPTASNVLLSAAEGPKLHEIKIRLDMVYLSVNMGNRTRAHAPLNVGLVEQVCVERGEAGSGLEITKTHVLIAAEGGGEREAARSDAALQARMPS